MAIPKPIKDLLKSLSVEYPHLAPRIRAAMQAESKKGRPITCRCGACKTCRDRIRQQEYRKFQKEI